MEKTFEETLRYVSKIQEGKRGKFNAPKIMKHLELSTLMSEDEERIVALLHDILEEKTVEDLRLEGFSENIIEAVETLTRKSRETNAKFAIRINDNPIAQVVMHGLMISEVYGIPKDTLAEKAKKLYEKNEDLLTKISA